jgi:hypothetical protein
VPVANLTIGSEPIPEAIREAAPPTKLVNEEPASKAKSLAISILVRSAFLL